MMPSLSGTVFCLLLWKTVAAQTEEMRCSVTSPVGTLHPVRGLLERFEAGPGCAAREHGNKETHVVAVGTVTDPENKVTVLLKPLSLSSSPVRSLHLLLSSKLPVRWWLEAERLPPRLPVFIQVSSNSSVQSNTLRLHVQTLHLIPFRPRALHRWALKHHGNLSSLTHTTHGNRVYIRLGEDPTLPAVCQLQAMFLSHNYITSDLQPQEVQGCVCAPAGGSGPEVHVVKLHSAGSGLCGSLQVEVVVSVVPPAGNSKPQNVVLILSSSVPVNWAIDAHGVRGHISVHSSNSVSPPYPPEPELTLSSTLVSDLSSISELLVWARERGYTEVSSYTEADLANRFVIQLAGGGTDEGAVSNPLAVRPPWAEERRLRLWLNRRGREIFTVQCEDGRLSVSVDQHTLQGLSDSVAAVTLRDPMCQAQSNESHFLLVFPVISCGTEGLLIAQPRGVQYKNMVLLWRDEPQSILSLNETEKKSKSPLGIHISCVAAVPAPPGPAVDIINEPNSPETGLLPWEPRGQGPDPELSLLPTPRHRPGPVLLLKLFVSESYEQRRIGPCVIPANHRIYIEISAEGPLTGVVKVKSCVVSPQSDPKKSPSWSVISDGCSSDPSLILGAKRKDAEEEVEEMEEGRINHRDGEISLQHTVERREAPRTTERSPNIRAEEKIQPLRFSFILRPVYNDSMQFLHCSLHLCVSDSTTDESMKEAVKKDCQGGRRVPPLVSKSSGHQCETRNLSRPVVLTQSITSLAPKPQRPPAGQRTKRLSMTPLASPYPEDRGSELPTGPVMGIVFLAFVMGVGLMGGAVVHL
uniref:ZP domain-containing protein n=1 Tax=Anabas testudineus TaxID=64144 RepID=A0A3Q1IDT0_ANATE